MVSELFDQAFRRLVQAFGRYHDTPRTAATVTDLGRARMDLDDARDDARVAREELIAANPRLSGPPRQTGVGQDDLARLRVLGTGFVQG